MSEPIQDIPGEHIHVHKYIRTALWVYVCKCSLCTGDSKFPAKSGVPAKVPQQIHVPKRPKPQQKCVLTVLQRMIVLPRKLT